MDMVKCIGKMEVFIKDNGKKEYKMDKEKSLFKIVDLKHKVFSKITYFKINLFRIIYNIIPLVLRTLLKIKT